MTETVTMTVSHLLHKFKDAGHAGTLQLGEHRGRLKQLLHHLHVRLDAPDEIGPCRTQLLHQVAQLLVELAPHGDEVELALPLAAVVLPAPKDLPDEWIPALLDEHLEGGV